MDSRYVLNTLKVILRKKKVTYKVLAEHLDISEAGVKKMFISGDLSLSRLMRICSFIDVSMEELIQASQNRPVKKLKINGEQTVFFSKNPDYFFFFLKLVVERFSAEEIADESGLTQQETWIILKKLDELKLIKLHPDNEIEFLQPLPLAIDSEGDFFRKLKIDMAQKFIEEIRPKEKESADLFMTQFLLSEDNMKQFRDDLKKLHEFYQRQTEVDKTIHHNQDLFDFSVLSAYGTFSYIPKIKEI